MINFPSSLGSDFIGSLSFLTFYRYYHERSINLIISFVVDWPLSLVEQELLTFPDHTSSPPVLSGVRVTRSVVVCVFLVDRCLSFCPFCYGHCIVCPTIYRF